MRNAMIMAVLLIGATQSRASELYSDQLCGKLYSECRDGVCRAMILPDRCLKGPDCYSGEPLTVVTDDELAGVQLSDLLRHGEGTRVCSEGTKDRAGVFHIVSISSIFGYQDAPF